MDYFSKPGVSKSMLDIFHKNPYSYKYYFLDGNPRPSTSSQEFGSLVHEAILEPEKFKDKVRSDEEFLARGSRLTKAFKEAKQNFVSENPNFTIVKQDDYFKIVSIRDAILNNPICAKLLNKGEAEKELFWNHTGIPCKAKLDFLSDDQRKIIDLKTTSDAATFETTLLNYRYYVQAAFYQWGVKKNFQRDAETYFIVVEKEPPHGLRVCVLDLDSVSFGLTEALQDLKLLRKCDISNHYPNYAEHIEEIRIPEWRIARG